jgi:Zn-dependent M28 family amino/carboxypeptidase
VGTITLEEIRHRVYFLASDFLGGRRPDAPGYSIAAEYAASQFRSAGVRPALTGADGQPTYFQRVPLMGVTTSVDRPFTLSTTAGDRVIESLNDLKLIGRGPSLSKVPMVFIGYGISEPDHGWDDLAGLDLKGKVAVMLAGAPSRDGKPVLPDAVHRSYQSIAGARRKVQSPRLRQNRPDALVIVADQEAADAWDLVPNVIGESQIQYRPGPGPGQAAVPPAAIAMVKGALAEAIFAGQNYNPLGIPKQGLSGYKTFEFEDVRLSLGLRADAVDFESVNVIGLVPGTDPALAGEFVTVGAHLDHINPAGSQIRNGADDNASGNARTVKWPLDFESEEGSMAGSDHYNFHRQGIPTAFFFSGRHDDLHEPTDDPDKIDYEKALRLSQLVYEVTAELANRDKSIRPPAAK